MDSGISPEDGVAVRLASMRPGTVILVICAALIGGCARQKDRVGDIVERQGDEIMVAGQLVHTRAPVVLWFDPGGYDAYRVERRFVPIDDAPWEVSGERLDSPNRFGLRRAGLSDEEIESVRGGGWELDQLRGVVDQFVIHYDASGTSRQCFKILHDTRGLSVHFLLDIDGTIYQTLDVKERAWHATKANDRSVGIEIAQIGAYDTIDGSPLETWYAVDETGRTRIRIPDWQGDGGIRTEGFVGRPARSEPVTGAINGRELVQYDFTDEQYDSLAKLTAALCIALPEIACDYPREADGSLMTRTMTPDEFDAYSGLIGHWHVQENKIDPGPAFDWERVTREAQAIMRRSGAR